MEYTVQNLEYAVSVFYNSEQNERAQAHQWLTTAQRCPEAWGFVWDLLQSHKGTEVQFFAATTLHTKLLRCWGEVPADKYDELKNKILQAVVAFSNGPKIVLNRLCISLAAYILQQGGADLADTLRPLSEMDNVSVLLEVLTVIPEEFNSMTMGVSLRTRTRSALQRACPAVLDDMLAHLQTVFREQTPSEEQTATWCKAAMCAASWLALGGDEEVCRESGISTSLHDSLPLCQALLQVVHKLYNNSECVSDTGLEACEAALSAVRAAGAAPDASRYPQAALQLLTGLAALAHPILARDDKPNSQNEELLAAVLTCAVALGECHTRALVAAAERVDADGEGARAFIRLILACQAAPGHYPLHETRSQLAFGFWYMLQDEVTCNLESIRNVSETWRGVFSRLLDVLIEKSRAPPDASLARDDAELLRCYRQDIADTVMYCYSVLGEECWAAVERAWQAGGTGGGGEAALHVFLALADAAPAQRCPRALGALFQHAASAAATATEPRLLHTALECLGAYASWLGSLEGAAGSGEWARAALQAAGAALPRAPARAALALRKLSAECQDHAASLAQDITQAAQSASGRYDGWVWRQLLGAAGAALAAAPPAAAAPLLHDLARTLYDDLQALAPGASEESADRETSRRSSGPRAGGAEAAAALLTALASRKELAAALLRTLMPALPPLAKNPAHVPGLFQLLKQAVSVLMDDCLPMLDDLAELALQALYTYPCPSGIDLVRLKVLMFGAQWPGAARLLRACAESSERVCAANLADAPDVAEALFAALQAITKKKPQYLDFLDEMLPQVIELGCACVRMWEAGAAKAACGWLAALAAERPSALAIYAPALAASAVRCIGGATPRNQVEPLADLLLALNRAQWPQGDLGHWLRGALAPPDFPSPHANQQHKQKFINAVLKEKSSKRRLLETVQEFSLVCRGLIGTEYARQTIAARQLVA